MYPFQNTSYLPKNYAKLLKLAFIPTWIVKKYFFILSLNNKILFIVTLVDRANPEGELTMSSELTHSAPQLQVDPKTNTVSMPCCKGYCSSKASHGIESGKWYFEVQILKGSVRVGWGQALAEIQAPIGYDEYGYGYSNKNRKIFHCSKGYSIESESESEDQKKKKKKEEIKVIGCLLNIPQDLELEENESIKSEIKRKYPPLNFLTTYNVKQNVLKRGSIQFYADGQELVGAKFENIYRAKYFPTVSIFSDAVIKVCFKLDEFSFDVPDGALPYEMAKNHERREE